MLATFLMALVVLLVVVAAMAVGVIFGRPPIKGSCGGMAAIGLGNSCDICGGDRSKCDAAAAADEVPPAADAQFYDAARSRDQGKR